MISDEPDEDADELDDDGVFESVIGPSAVGSGSARPAADTLPDWPASYAQAVGIEIDAATIAWFQAHHPDWRNQIRLVLRGWILKKMSGSRTLLVTRPAVSMITYEGASRPSTADSHPHVDQPNF